MTELYINSAVKLRNQGVNTEDLVYYILLSCCCKNCLQYLIEGNFEKFLMCMNIEPWRYALEVIPYWYDLPTFSTKWDVHMVSGGLGRYLL